jgi:hypothetical protein
METDVLRRARDTAFGCAEIGSILEQRKVLYLMLTGGQYSLITELDSAGWDV